ncbi:Metallo-dependent phosphatase-like protein [Lasiosphaeria ovina]|uniref:Metallo-dependent phosphatase-like protein n=1 Tax=Lasiosphaeria ovina TaxID=92902 RepID=A0AAE0N0T7_9PEZI|nr:Metallo-dependent phosphatase-like protein [Lasiosphaeria ovina]
MTRRIVRTVIQVSTAALLTFVVIFFLDRNFRVLPNAIHEYLPTHHAGLIITDLTITTCSSYNIFSNCKLDPAVWHRVEKDLYLGKGTFSSAYLHISRKREEDLTSDDKVLVDVTVGRLNPNTNDKENKGELWESRPAGLWVKRSSKRSATDSSTTVTGVDVLFGDDAVEARNDWAITRTPLLLDAGSDVPAAHITIRRGAEHAAFKPTLRINPSGRFKIMQLADLHLSTGLGNCRDALPEDWNGGKCEADPRTLDFVTKMLAEERPNLVVLSGDQVNGDTAPDTQSAIFKYAQLLIEHKIPYVSIFGNHDDEGSMSRAAQMDLIETLPYSLSRAGPEDIDGVGNYYIEILARKGSDHSAITVYLLDTHAYSPNERKFPGYDWVKKNQIDWFKSTAQRLKKPHKEYTHGHMDVAFIHIPLPEYRGPNITMWREWKEPSTAPVYNSHFHDAMVEEGVVMVSCGHDHVNEYCALSQKEDGKPAMWMCYGGATGFGGYAGYGGYHRKMRIFDFDMNESRITTWKRVEYGDDKDKRLEELIMVDGGRPVPPVVEEEAPPPVPPPAQPPS